MPNLFIQPLFSQTEEGNLKVTTGDLKQVKGTDASGSFKKVVKATLAQKGCCQETSSKESCQVTHEDRKEVGHQENRCQKG